MPASNLPIATLLAARKGKPVVATIDGTRSLKLNPVTGSVGAGQLGVDSGLLLINGGGSARVVNMPPSSASVVGSSLTIKNTGTAAALNVVDAQSGVSLAAVAQNGGSAEFVAVFDGVSFTWVAV